MRRLNSMLFVVAALIVFSGCDESGSDVYLCNDGECQRTCVPQGHPGLCIPGPGGRICGCCADAGCDFFFTQDLPTAVDWVMGCLTPGAVFCLETGDAALYVCEEDDPSDNLDCWGDACWDYLFCPTGSPGCQLTGDPLAEAVCG
ncbi:MAG: hypothetical protein HY825_20390 [Acidobacteria bacterium]|nr:hypothetical protein [Acidobacteriota bacterium]